MDLSPEGGRRGREEEPGDSSGTVVAVLLAGRLAPSRADALDPSPECQARA